ncbi:MAG: hypothetical protein SFY32_16820 [Bacteroidota bacterium]|nr:hypothetical protein [Bacteroidota bacterium]
MERKMEKNPERKEIDFIEPMVMLTPKEFLELQQHFEDALKMIKEASKNDPDFDKPKR